MHTATTVLIAIVAVLHLYFLVLEMFLWDTPYGHKTFSLTPEFAAASKSLAANQGLYNGFLAAGLIWGLLDPDSHAFEIKIFFLSCAIVAGIYGGITVNRKIFFVQSVPALIPLVLLHIR